MVHRFWTERISSYLTRKPQVSKVPVATSAPPMGGMTNHFWNFTTLLSAHAILCISSTQPIWKWLTCALEAFQYKGMCFKIHLFLYFDIDVFEEPSFFLYPLALPNLSRNLILDLLNKTTEESWQPSTCPIKTPRNSWVTWNWHLQNPPCDHLLECFFFPKKLLVASHCLANVAKMAKRNWNFARPVHVCRVSLSLKSMGSNQPCCTGICTVKSQECAWNSLTKHHGNLQKPT